MDDAFHAPAYIELTKVSDELPLAMLYEMADMVNDKLKTDYLPFDSFVTRRLLFHY